MLYFTKAQGPLLDLHWHPNGTLNGPCKADFGLPLVKDVLKNEDNLKNEDDLQNEDDLKNKDDLKNQDDLKNEDNLKNENDLKNWDNLKKWPSPPNILAHPPFPPPPLPLKITWIFFDDLSPQQPQDNWY